MAEEKKTTGKKATTSVKKGEIKTGSASTKKGTTTRKSTTKKTTTKVEAVEKINIPVSEDTSEVRLEKKFCTKCGKELLGNAVCDCENGASVSETQRQNSDPMLSFFNRFTDLFKKMYKNPIETIKSETDKANLTNAVAILLIIGLSFGIFMMGFFKNMFISVTHLGVRIMAILSGNSGDMMTFTDLMDKSGEVSLPYFTQFLYGILIFLIFTAAIVLISYAIARVLKKNDFDLKKALTLFVVSMIPTIGVFLGMAVLFTECMEGKGCVSRWGGEEFLLVFRHMNGDEALIVLNDLNRKMKKLQVAYKEERIRVTMTFGLSEFDFEHGIDYSVNDVDKKLYRGKEAGRDRTIY